MQRSIVIVGGGLAAAAAAESYRSAGGDAPVTILSQDADRPVHRPPLSKEYLRGDATLDSVYVHHADFYAEQNIDLRLNTRVVAIDRAAGEVVLAEGERIAYGTLVLATGARSRTVQLPGATLPGTFSLRSLASAEALKLTFADAARAVIVGAGFIGMEVAATLTQRGVRTTIVEMAPRMWQALVPPIVSDFVQSYYQDRGVDFRFSSGVRAIEGDGRVERVVLDTGESLEADLVVIGVGAELNTGLAEGAGLAVERGVTVDEFFQTSDPRIYAIGDIASFPDPVAGRIHLEHWDNALNQGRALGQTLAEKGAGFHHTAYFFSDLFDLSLNMVGYPSGWDDVIVRGDPADRQFTVVYLKEGLVRAALMINDDEHMDAWTRLVDTRQPADASLSDRDIAPLEAAV